MSQYSKKVDALLKRLGALEPMLPGSLSEQWNVCGTPGCRCKDAVKPQRHGPYYQLSFSVAGKSSTLFVKPEDAPEVRARIKRYREFRQLVSDTVRAFVDLARHEGFKRSA